VVLKDESWENSIKKVGFNPLPAIGISSKKYCDELYEFAPKMSVAYFFS
jgi:hypothetical protein